MASNNFDRMITGETPAPAIPNRAKVAQGQRKRRAVVGVMAAFCCLSLVLVALLAGAAGASVQNALLGVFGWSGIGYGLAVVAGAIFVWARKPLAKRARAKGENVKKARVGVVLGIAVLAVCVLVYLQIITTVGLFATLEGVHGKGNAVSFEAYAAACFQNGRQTSGGVLMALLSYLPMITGARAWCIGLAVLFFLVLFALIWPFWFINKEQRLIAEEGASTLALSETDTPAEDKLFVASIAPEPSRRGRGRGRERAREKFDLRFPNDEAEDVEEEAIDPMDDLDAGLDETAPEYKRILAAESNPEARRRMAKELLLDLPAEEASKLFMPRESESDSSREADHPLQFGERKSVVAEFGAPKPASEAPVERRRSSFDILFGEPEPTPPPKPVERPRPSGIMAGETMETILPKKMPPELPRREEPRPAVAPSAPTVAPAREPITPTARPTVPPSAPTPPPSSTPAARGISWADSASSVPQTPASTAGIRPTVYPSFTEEDPLERALDTLDEPMEDEEEIEVDPRGYVEREEEAVPPSFGGFVAREVPSREKEEDKGEDVADVDVVPRTLAIPVERTRAEARAFAPAPKRTPRPYVAPPLSLLNEYAPPVDMEDYNRMYSTLEEAFASYGIEVRVIGHTRGPTYTQYAVQLADGVSFKRVATLEQDIVRKMRLSEEISIVPKVKNLDAIGIEVVNRTRARVPLKPLLSGQVFRQEKKLYFVLGVDVMGNPYYCDILSGPHMLIAGSSGSGKSVCLNTLICSLLFNYKPDYVKFILIDPKGGVELDVYNDLPHNLLGKAAVTPTSTIRSLDWAIEEMERRYGMMKEANVRNLGAYNDVMMSKGYPRVPYLLVIIDELADLMKSSKKMATDLEQRIARLTAKARACGIHVIVATQRPSVDVITGTIKNNIPTRVAFKTATQIDSKTILEKGCAEKLYGKGDMFFMSSEFNEFKRLQGPFLDDSEVYSITEYIREHNDSTADETLADRIFREDPVDSAGDAQIEEDFGITKENAASGTLGGDSLFEQAVRYAVTQGSISISRLQRAFRIGFTRAGYLIDEMEKRGIIDVAVPGSSQPRRVMITSEELEEIFPSGEDD